MTKTKLLQLFILPFVFYIIPIVDIKFIPEIKKEYIYFSLCSIIFILYAFILFKNWKFIVTTKKKFLTTFLLVVFFFIHITVLFIIDLTYNGLKLTKEVIKVKSESFEPTIYIVKTIGIFNIYEGAEIGYSKRFSPFYNKYYRTKNHLQVVLEDSNQIIIREYRYERPDSSKKILIPRSELIKKEIKVIQINRSRLK